MSLTDEQKIIIDELSKVEWTPFNKCHTYFKNKLVYTLHKDGKYNILNVFEADHISQILVHDEGNLLYSINLSEKEYFDILKISHDKECKINKEKEKETVSRIIKSLVN